jgi:cysteine protease ATG4
VYVNGDGPDVYEDAVLRLAKQADDSFRPVLILVGVRLGIERVNPVYGEALKKTLQLPQSIGIAGYVILISCDLESSYQLTLL